MDCHQTEQVVHESNLGGRTHGGDGAESRGPQVPRTCSSNCSASPGSFPLASIDGHLLVSHPVVSTILYTPLAASFLVVQSFISKTILFALKVFNLL